MNWKALSVYPEIKEDYVVSEYGEISSVDRIVYVEETDKRSSYYRHYDARTIAVRNNNLNQHLFATVSKVIDGKPWVKTMYVHKIVAQLFLDPPKDKDKVYVEHIDDDYENNHYSNLRWISHSELQTRNMNERYPENKNRLKEANVKSGYYLNMKGKKRKKK